MSTSLFKKAKLRTATAAVATVAASLSVVSGAGTAEAATALTSNDFIGYTMKAIGILNVAKQQLKDKNYKAALKSVDDYYYQAYDPYIEPPSRALSPVNGQLRKPMMEGLHDNLHFDVAACIPEFAKKGSLRKCNPAQNFTEAHELQINVARDGLLLAGLISDSTEESKKIAAASALVAAVTNNPDTVKPMIEATYNGKQSNDAVKFAQKAISKAGSFKKGHTYTDADGWIAVLTHPATWSAEAKSYLSSEDEGEDQGENNSGSASYALPAAVVIAVVATIAALLPKAQVMGLIHLPKLPAFPHMK